MDRGYELRNQGPATLSLDALDTVVEREWDLQAHREAVDTWLECELKGAASHEAGLDNRETTGGGAEEAGGGPTRGV
jgi:hypothetical protein